MAQECFDKAVNNGLSPIFFDAIDGNYAKELYKETNIFPAMKFKKNRLGVLGCFFSHYKLWEMCASTDEPFLILEHDGYMLKPLPENIFDLFTDVLKLDRLDPYSSKYNTQLLSEDTLPITIEKYYNPKAKILKTKKFNGTGNYFKGAYAYILKPLGAQKLLEFIKEHGHVPADQQIGDLVLDTYTTVPSIARLHPYYSIGDNINSASLTKHLEKK